MAQEVEIATRSAGYGREGKRHWTPGRFPMLLTRGCDEHPRWRCYRAHPESMPLWLPINFGILPLTFINPADYADTTEGDILEIKDAPGARIGVG